MPLKDGRLGVCRVIRKELLKETPIALVAATDWISSQPPSLNHPSIRKILTKNHHNWKNAEEVLWVTSPPPKDFVVIGRIGSDSNDAKIKCNSYGGWESCAIQALAQWRWDNEREAVLMEDEKKKLVETANRNAVVQKRVEYLSKVTFSSLLGKNLLSSWEDYPPKVANEGCQKILQSFIRVLDEAEKPLDQNFVASELKKCVEELNQFDDRNKNFIETVEREDLCEVLEDIVNAAKFPNLVEKIEDWRDW